MTKTPPFILLLLVFAAFPFSAQTVRDPSAVLRLTAEELAPDLDPLFNGVSPEDPRFFRTPQPNPQGVVVVAHGLNSKPSKMGSPSAEGTIVKLLLDSGYHVARIALTGHTDSIDDMKSASVSQWLADAYTQYCFAFNAAKAESLPLYLTAFSMGALLYEVLMNEDSGTPVRFEKAVLFSPAVAIRGAAKSVLLLNPVLKDSSVITSLSPASYRAQKGASLGAYKALFNLEERFDDNASVFNNIETLVFIERGDEFISLNELERKISRFDFSQWRIQEVSNNGSKLTPKYRHLIIDSDCVSEDTWGMMSEAVMEHLSVPSSG
jgi:esterase/lipase